MYLVMMFFVKHFIMFGAIALGLLFVAGTVSMNPESRSSMYP